MGYSLENTLEKLARILSRQFNVEVLFEGNQAYTDGKKIVLPFFQNMTDEMEKDLNGYLDHEVAHVRYTQFKEVVKVINHYHKQLLNGVEDIRIERLMMQDFPGTEFNLVPLRSKLRKQMSGEFSKFPWPVKLIVAIMDYMQGHEVPKDKEIDRHMAIIADELSELNKCTNTSQLREVTERIVRKISQDREDEKKESEKKKNGKGEKGKGEQGKGQSGEGSPSDGNGEMQVDPSVSADKEKHDEMIKDSYCKGSEESGFDKFEIDVHRMINKGLAKAIKEDMSAKKANYDYKSGSAKTSIPATTRFDKQIDFVGNDRGYARQKSQTASMVTSITQNLERIFKVVENARWKSERERGLINAASLVKLKSSPNYRTVFKEQLKNETNNIAVSILIDESGSMSGTKVETAKLAATAMSEALKRLDINFEVCGFHAISSHEMSSFSRSIEGGTSRFGRQHEALEHHVFKSFDSDNLTGLSNIKAGGNNNDGESVLWCAKRLSERKEKRKILIVMSDGMPAGEPDCALLQSDLRVKLAMIEKFGIETVGIGIQTKAVEHFYKDYIVVNELKDLTGAALNKLSKILLKNFRY